MRSAVKIIRSDLDHLDEQVSRMALSDLALREQVRSIRRARIKDAERMYSAERYRVPHASEDEKMDCQKHQVISLRAAVEILLAENNIVYHAGTKGQLASQPSKAKPITAADPD